MGTGGPVLGAKHGRGVTLTTLYVSIMRWNQSQKQEISPSPNFNIFLNLKVHDIVGGDGDCCFC
jgi:hypothetical protein